MSNSFHLDSLDKKILDLLSKNARMPYLEIARNCKVSGAAIHQRVQKMKEAGVFKGTQIVLSPKGAGYLTCAFIGIQVNLITPKTHEEVYEKISKIPEVVECHHVSGRYSLFVKVFAKTNEHLKEIIVGHIQSIVEVTATETIISLQEGFTRMLPID